MIVKIESEIIIEGVGKVKHTHTQTFNDDANVFSRAYDYRQYMKKTFPGCEYYIIKAKEL